MPSTSGFAVPVARDLRFDCHSSPLPDPEPGPRLELHGSLERVLLVVGTRGSSWTLGLDLAGELGRRGIEVALACAGAPLTVEQCRQAGALVRVELFESELEAGREKDPEADLALVGSWLLDLEARLSPHVVHVDAYALGALPWRAPVVVSGNATLFSPAGREAGLAESWRRCQRLIGDGVKAADLVVAPTRFELRSLQRQHGPLRRCRAIEPGLAAGGFRPGHKEPLVFAGGLPGGEAVAAMLRVANRLSWPVAAAGDADPGDVPGAAIGPVFRVATGRPAHLASWLSRASIFALPEGEDLAGVAALEAAHAGCALVLAGTPAYRELWGDAAVFVPPGDEGALAGAVESLARDDVRRQGLARAARERAARRTLVGAVNEHLGAYRQALAARRSGMRAMFGGAAAAGLGAGDPRSTTLH